MTIKLDYIWAESENGSNKCLLCTNKKKCVVNSWELRRVFLIYLKLSVSSLKQWHIFHCTTSDEFYQ
jgi:hypothetical protein